MEQLIAGAKFPSKCVKNEIHNLLTTLRLTKHREGTKEQRFHGECLKSFQRLFEELTFCNELHEFDTLAYLGPFLEVIKSDATDGQLTAVALGAVDKFVSFGLISPDSPRCTEAITTLAYGVIHCNFVSSGTAANDEAVLLKMVGVLVDCLRCPAGEYLSDMCVWHMVRKCYLISRLPRGSSLLRSSAEGMLQQMVLTIFGTQKARARRIRVLNANDKVGAGADGAAVQVYKPYGFRAMLHVLKFLSYLQSYGIAGGAAKGEGPAPKPRRPLRRQRSRSPGCDRPQNASDSRASSPESSQADEPPPELGLTDVLAGGAEKDELKTDTHCLGLSLLNVAMEAGGDELAKSDDLLCVIQDDICKSLLQNSRSDSLSVLSLTLRAIFNLFLHFRKHLKIQLEIFFTSVHLKIAGQDSASYEQRELALESLLEFCREPELMIELYENYDCDVRCTNLFETLVKFLGTHAFPADGVKGVRGGFNSLHRLALSGLLSILRSIALRCEAHGHFRVANAEAVERPSSPIATESSTQAVALQRKKEQKRRLAIAARTFNSDPSKSMAALQSLGLVSSPPTAESMAAFLKHTPGLDLRQVGEYLAKRKDFNGEVRKVFMELLSYAGLGLTEALRMTLQAFRLPGEAQLIERLMESFAEAYFVHQVPVDTTEDEPNPLKRARWIPRDRPQDDNDGMGGGPGDGAGESPSRVRMQNSDTIFILSYSIIMLNTDLHKPGIKKRMTTEDFLRNNRGIDNGKNMPDYYLSDIYESIRDDEIRMQGEAATDNETVDDYFWEGILRRSESIDEFNATERLLSEAPPAETERDMLQVIMESAPLPTLQLCYESVGDVAVASEVMVGFQDLAKISFYYGQVDAVTNLVRTICQYFSKASATGQLTARSQISLRAAQLCVTQHVQHFQEKEWRTVLDVLLQLWALDLLPPHLTEFDDFTGPDGKPLQSLCDLGPPFPAPPQKGCSATGGEATGRSPGPEAGIKDGFFSDSTRQSTQGGDSFLESLTAWFEDETRDDEETEDELDGFSSATSEALLVAASRRSAGGADEEALPISHPDPAVVHQKVKQYVARSGFVDLFTAAGGISKLQPESMQILARALVLLSRPAKWSSSPAVTTSVSPAASPASGDAAVGAALLAAAALAPGPSEVAAAEWHELADPVFGLELLTNMTCMPLGVGQKDHVSQIWPLVSTHFERLLQHVLAGGGGSERQFIERLIVNTLRLCIRLISHADFGPTLLTLTQHLSKLPEGLFALYSERIACGVLVLLQETQLPHSGLRIVFALLKRISETPGNVGACNAGLECLNYWLSDDGELARLLSLQQFPELLATLKAFAMQSSTQASSTALGHLSSLVPQLARGARQLPNATCQWQQLWVPTLHVLADIAKEGAQKSSAQAFVYLQRLLLERGTQLSLPWEALPFEAWKECLEQVLMPLLQSPSADSCSQPEVAGARQASAAQLLCLVVLTHFPNWLAASPDGFPVLFLRMLHVLVSEATTSTYAREPLEQSLKNLMSVISADPGFNELPSPTAGETLLQATWGVVSPSLPDLRREVQLILDPMAAEDSMAGAVVHGGGVAGN